MLLHVPKTGHVLLLASKVKRVPIPCGLQTAGNYDHSRFHTENDIVGNRKSKS
jgi:hypothetical protein